MWESLQLGRQARTGTITRTMTWQIIVEIYSSGPASQKTRNYPHNDRPFIAEIALSAKRTWYSAELRPYCAEWAPYCAKSSDRSPRLRYQEGVHDRASGSRSSDRIPRLRYNENGHLFNKIANLTACWPPGCNGPHNKRPSVCSGRCTCSRSLVGADTTISTMTGRVIVPVIAPVLACGP